MSRTCKRQYAKVSRLVSTHATPQHRMARRLCDTRGAPFLPQEPLPPPVTMPSRVRVASELIHRPAKPQDLFAIRTELSPASWVKQAGLRLRPSPVLYRGS